MLKTYFSAPLSKNAKDTEGRIRNIFEGQRKRPAAIVLALVAAVALLCGSVVAVRVKKTMPTTEDRWEREKKETAADGSAAQEKALATFRLTQEGSEAETPREALLRALRGELAFPLDTSQTRSFSLGHEVTLPELTAEDGDTMAQAAYAFLDLDGDGTEEAVYQRSNYRGFYVLRWREGKVFGYEINYRGMMDLKQDRTFGASGGAGDNGYCRLRFSDTELMIEPFMWRLENAVGEETCTIEGETVSHREYFRAMEERDAKPGAE